MPEIWIFSSVVWHPRYEKLSGWIWADFPFPPSSSRCRRHYFKIHKIHLKFPSTLFIYKREKFSLISKAALHPAAHFIDANMLFPGFRNSFSLILIQFLLLASFFFMWNRLITTKLLFHVVILFFAFPSTYISLSLLFHLVTFLRFILRIELGNMTQKTGEMLELRKSLFFC